MATTARLSRRPTATMEAMATGPIMAGTTVAIGAMEATATGIAGLTTAAAMGMATGGPTTVVAMATAVIAATRPRKDAGAAMAPKHSLFLGSFLGDSRFDCGILTLDDH